MLLTKEFKKRNRHKCLERENKRGRGREVGERGRDGGDRERERERDNYF